MVLIAPSDVDWDAIANHEDVDDIMEEHEAAMASLGLQESPTDRTDGKSTGASPEPANHLETTISMEDPVNVARELSIIIFPPYLTEHLGPSVPYIMTRLGSLPPEIKTVIFSWVLGFDHRIDLTVAHAKNGHPCLWFSSFFPEMREPFSTYLRACSGLRQEGIDHLPSTTVFANCFSDPAKHFPKLYGKVATAMIRHFELHMHFINKVNHETTWPALLNTLIEDIPNLRRLTALSNYPSNGQIYPLIESGDPTGSVSRDDQERRSLLRFGAFLTLRHPTLKVLVVPATSGSWYLSERNEHKSVIRIELYPSEFRRTVQRMLRRALPTIEEATEHTDAVMMNSTAIRRLKWTELARRDPTSLALAVDAKTSEVPEEHDFYRWVDAKGYMSYQKLRQKKLGARQEVDKLIDLARRDEWQAATSPFPYTVRGGRARRYGNGGSGYGSGRGARRGAGTTGSDSAVPDATGNASAGHGRGFRGEIGAGRGRGGRGSHS